MKRPVAQAVPGPLRRTHPPRRDRRRRDRPARHAWRRRCSRRPGTGAEKPRIWNWSRSSEDPRTPRRLPSPVARKRKIQLVDGTIKSDGYQRLRATRSFGCGSTVKIDQGGRIGGELLLCSIHANRIGTLRSPSSGGLRMLYPRSSKAGIYSQEVPDTIAGRLQRPRQRTRRSSNRRPVPTLHHRDKASSSNGPSTRSGPSASNTSSPAASRSRTSSCPSTRSGKPPTVPAATVVLHADHQRRQGDRPHRGRR